MWNSAGLLSMMIVRNNTKRLKQGGKNDRPSKQMRVDPFRIRESKCLTFSLLDHAQFYLAAFSCFIASFNPVPSRSPHAWRGREHFEDRISFDTKAGGMSRDGYCKVSKLSPPHYIQTGWNSPANCL
ncbi:hypothetical protein CEXT_92621 [Caerostris extrusa]|uniref:Uncharacterized protein n=1 Tax=Caerostris extrusa TaxID=172846 RepID=A0AAV4S637_CAEEX|nr:hypothetical protein CEXT_92621 [Caerostris extrusa]